MRRIIIGLMAVTLLAVTAGFATASSPHFIGTPELTPGETTLTATGSVAGLGNEDIAVTLAATGIASVACQNYGGNFAPGQDTVVDVSGTQTDIETKNGRAWFSVTTAEPGPLDPAVVCPNPRWTAHIVSVEFISATLTVYQPVGADEPALTQWWTQG